MDEMTLGELVSWAARTGRMVVPIDVHEQLCADAADAAARCIDFDRDFHRLFGQVDE
jgi:hypothetical protein